MAREVVEQCVEAYQQPGWPLAEPDAELTADENANPGLRRVMR